VDQPDEGPAPRRVEVDITELIPTAWQEQQVWLSCYRAFCVPQRDLMDTEPFELLGVRCQFFWGGAPYWKSTLSILPQTNGGVVVQADVQGIQHADDGPYLMLMTATDRGGTPMAEEETHARIRSVLALLRLALGRNVAVEPLGDLIFTASTKKVTAMERGFRPPSFDGPPDISEGGSRFVSLIHDAIDALDEGRRNRVELSLQWFFRAEQAHGVSCFLMYWFTLEALAMPGATSLAALEDQLGAIYELERQAARDRFRMGRLYGLRGDIVHQGLHPSIHFKVLEFLAAVYWDLLLDTLGLDARYAAGAVLDGQDVDEWFPR